MTTTERLDAIESRALAPWSVQGVGQSLSDAVDLVTALRAVLDLHREARSSTSALYPAPACTGCCQDYPCPTVRVIEEVLS